MGHYARLVRAISHVDHHLIKLLRGRRWIEAFHHLDGRFLLMLAIGIATGIVLLANAMHFLLDVYLPETFSVFLGLLVASVWVVVRSVEKWTSSSSCVLALGILIAYGISMLPSTSGDPSLPYLFLAASVAICRNDFAGGQWGIRTPYFRCLSSDHGHHQRVCKVQFQHGWFSTNHRRGLRLFVWLTCLLAPPAIPTR